MSENSTAKEAVEVSKENAEKAIDIYKGQMSILIMVVARSGRGKSHAMHDLDPETTFVIKANSQPLPFIKNRFYQEGVNVLTEKNPVKIRNKMKYVSRELPQVKDLIIDDAQYIMAAEFMDKVHEKGYDKWNIIANNTYRILTLASELRGDLKVYYLVHEETSDNERKMKTLGKLLDDKITCEGLSTIVLFGDVQVANNKRTYYFATQSDGYTSAKSPFGMFPDKIKNDYRLISQRVDEYFSGVTLKESKLDLDP